MAPGGPISYSVDGSPGAPPLLFINSIATTRDLWSRQVGPCVDAGFRVITYDARGHGRSVVPAGDYTIAQLGGDAISILDEVGVESAHVCGISLGGITAMWLGVHAPQRVKSLIVANTAARIGSLQMWTERIALVRDQGMAALASMTMPRWFTEAFRSREPQTIQQFASMVAQCPQDGYLGCCAALRDEDLREAIAYCESVRDYISRDLFASILKDEEHHADFVDTQFDLIERIGIERYTLLNSDAAPDQGH